MTLDFKNIYKNVYFIGIGGVSMSSLAEILVTRGVSVQGSDINSSDITKHLESIGVKIIYDHKYENIPDNVDLVVFTAAVKSDNPEILAAKALGIKTIERSDLLGTIMELYSQSIAVSGTHGKTTTTSMLSEILLAANTDPTITVGGFLPTIGGNTQIGNSQFFLAEACEYHNSFLKFNPFVAIILNVEAEHLDFFKNLKEVQTSFKNFAKNVPNEGYVVIGYDIVGKDYITENLTSHVITYGLDKKADCYAENITSSSGKPNTFDIIFMGKKTGTASLKVPGKHNILNALSAFAASFSLGIDPEDIITGLNNYSGVNRRFQYKGTFNGVSVIDDYAHHPTEVLATLSAAKDTGCQRIRCIFQPHTYTRLKALLEDFGNAFEDADEIIVADIYAAREKDTGLIHSKDLVDNLISKGKSAQYLSSFDNIISFVKSTSKPEDMLLTMGAGDIYLVGEKLLNE